MNCLSVYQSKSSWLPYFSDEDSHILTDDKELQNYFRCKVYCDGTHKVAVPVTKIPGTRDVSVKGAIDYRFDELYLLSVKEGVKEKARVDFISKELVKEYPDEENLDAWIEEKCNAKIHNSYARRKRFRRKAYLNPWNYFVTFTYSDALQTEESFMRRLRKCLSNLHTRRGWKFMGVPEYSPDTHRLHYHMLIYVPDGEMVGEIKEVRDYSTKYKKMQVRHINTFFEQTFGRNDFEPLDDNNFSLNRTIDYILKYMEKDGERVIYSRGIPTELEAQIGTQDIASEFVDFVYKMVLFDDVFDDGADKLHKSGNAFLNIYKENLLE